MESGSTTTARAKRGCPTVLVTRIAPSLIRVRLPPMPRTLVTTTALSASTRDPAISPSARLMRTSSRRQSSTSVPGSSDSGDGAYHPRRAKSVSSWTRTSTIMRRSPEELSARGSRSPPIERTRAWAVEGSAVSAQSRHDGAPSRASRRERLLSRRPRGWPPPSPDTAGPEATAGSAVDDEADRGDGAEGAG